MNTTYYIPVSIVIIYFGYRILRNAYKKLKITDTRESKLKRVRRKMYYVANIFLSTYMFVLGLVLLASGFSDNIAQYVEPFRIALVNPFEFIFN